MPIPVNQLSIADQYAVANELILLLVELEAVQHLDGDRERSTIAPAAPSQRNEGVKEVLAHRTDIR